jgi:hypothetical protein
MFRAFAKNMSRWVANASASQPAPGHEQPRHTIKIGAIGFDQEQICGQINV